MSSNAVKKETPRALAATKTQGKLDTQNLKDLNYTIEGSFADSDLGEAIPLFTGWVPKDVVKNGITDCMICTGHCMNPTVRHGGVIGFDFYDRELIENEMYVFELEGWKPIIQLKRLFKVLPGLGLLLITDNPAWPDYFVREGRFKVIGKVKWIYNEGITIWG